MRLANIGCLKFFLLRQKVKRLSNLFCANLKVNISTKLLYFLYFCYNTFTTRHLNTICKQNWRPQKLFKFKYNFPYLLSTEKEKKRTPFCLLQKCKLWLSFMKIFYSEMKNQGKRDFCGKWFSVEWWDGCQWSGGVELWVRELQRRRKERDRYTKRRYT